MNRNDIMIFFQFLDMSLPPGGQIQKSIWLKYCTPIDFIICHKSAIHCACNYEQEWYLDFLQFLDISMPPGGQIHKSILLKCSTLISWFTTWLQFIVYVGLNYQQERWYDFFQFLDMSLPPGRKYRNQYDWNVVPW